VGVEENVSTEIGSSHHPSKTSPCIQHEHLVIAHDMAIANRHASPFDPSPSPQPPPTLTKRDVRRNRIMERLQGMIDAFQSNQHQHYRAQLQALQVDMTLVLRADPYGEGPLEDGGEDIRGLVDGVIVGQQGVGDEAAHKDFLALAGKKYKEFVREANVAMEQRDAELVALHVSFRTQLLHLRSGYI